MFVLEEAWVDLPLAQSDEVVKTVEVEGLDKLLEKLRVKNIETIAIP